MSLFPLKVCHPRCNNKNTICQYTTLYYSKFKIATCFGCTRQPPTCCMFQKWKLCTCNLYNLYNFLSTFLKHTAWWWLPCTTETCSYFKFVTTQSCVQTGCILIIACLFPLAFQSTIFHAQDFSVIRLPLQPL